LDNILNLPTFTDVNPNSLANTYAGHPRMGGSKFILTSPQNPVVRCHQNDDAAVHRSGRRDIGWVDAGQVTEVDYVFITFDDKGEDAWSAHGSVVDMDDGVICVSSGGVTNGVHEDFVVRFMVSPDRCLTEEVGKGWIGMGHGDKIILSADAGAKVNKTILVESSLDRQGEDCEHKKCCNFLVDFSFSIAVWILGGVGFSTGGTEE
jgi:hypothetical protein